MDVHELQFINMAALSTLALLSVGAVLLIKALQRREAALASGNRARLRGWRTQTRQWKRRYLEATLLLAGALFALALLLWPGAPAS